MEYLVLGYRFSLKNFLHGSLVEQTAIACCNLPESFYGDFSFSNMLEITLMLLALVILDRVYCYHMNFNLKRWNDFCSALKRKCFYLLIRQLLPMFCSFYCGADSLIFNQLSIQFQDTNMLNLKKLLAGCLQPTAKSKCCWIS